MKKVTIFVLMIVAVAAIFTSCKKDEPTGAAPTISFSNYPAGAYEIDFATLGVTTFDLSFVVSITAEDEIKTFTAKKKVGSTTSNITPAPADFDGKTSYTYNYLGTFTETDTYPVELTFSVTDKSDQTTEKTFTVTKKTAATGTPIFTWTATLGSISYNTTTGGYLNTTTGVVYKYNEANASSSDFGYIWGSTYPKAIFAPDWTPVQSLSQGPGSFSPKRATKFVKLSASAASDFDAIGATLDANNYISTNVGTPSAQYIDNLAVNDVLGFVTADNKKGLIKVTGIAGTASTDPAATITVAVKVQQ